MSEENKYSPTEESYARSFYRRLSEPGVTDMVAELLGGRLPCRMVGNEVYINCFKIKSALSFHEFDGRCVKLELRMESLDGVSGEDKEPEPLEYLLCLDEEGKEGRLSKELFKKIIEKFYKPSLKYFYELYGLSSK